MQRNARRMLVAEWRIGPPSALTVAPFEEYAAFYEAVSAAAADWAPPPAMPLCDAAYLPDHLAGVHSTEH